MRITSKKHKMVKSLKRELQQLLEPAKTISKTQKKTPKIARPVYDEELVNFMQEMYAHIIVAICYQRVHDEDGGCDVEYVGTKAIEEFQFRNETIKVVYLPVGGNEYGWCNEACYYINFPKKIHFSQATLSKIKLALEDVRQKLLYNFNELRHLSGGKWFEALEAPITARRILHLFYDLYFKKEDNVWKMKFKPGEKYDSPCNGRWCPYDVEEIYNESAPEMKAIEYPNYAKEYRMSGYVVSQAD